VSLFAANEGLKASAPEAPPSPTLRRRGPRGRRGGATAAPRRQLDPLARDMDLEKILGDEPNHYWATSQGVPEREPRSAGTDFVQRIFEYSDRNPSVLRNLGASTPTAPRRHRYLSILRSTRASSTRPVRLCQEPLYFDPANILELALEGECSAVATTLGVLGIVVAPLRASDPFICKLNHNDLLHYRTPTQVPFARCARRPISVRAPSGHDLLRLRAVRPQLHEVSEAFAEAHRLGMLPCLWCYLRNPAFKKTASTTTSRLTSPARPTTSA